jgi:hypothetical protein
LFLLATCAVDRFSIVKTRERSVIAVEPHKRKRGTDFVRIHTHGHKIKHNTTTTTTIIATCKPQPQHRRKDSMARTKQTAKKSTGGKRTAKEKSLNKIKDAATGGGADGGGIPPEEKNDEVTTRIYTRPRVIYKPSTIIARRIRKSQHYTNGSALTDHNIAVMSAYLIRERLDDGHKLSLSVGAVRCIHILVENYVTKLTNAAASMKLHRAPKSFKYNEADVAAAVDLCHVSFA